MKRLRREKSYRGKYYRSGETEDKTGVLLFRASAGLMECFKNVNNSRVKSTFRPPLAGTPGWA